MADLIVLAGCAGVEAAAEAAGYSLQIPFVPGRTDATPDMTDVESFAVLEPIADGFRNYIQAGLEHNDQVRPEELLIDKAYLLNLTPSEMTVLVGGLRVLGIGTDNTGPFTDREGSLTNDFFANLLDMSTEWTPIHNNKHPMYFEGRDRTSGHPKWTASRVDLLFGSHSVLRALAEVYACQDASADFVQAFGAAFAKVMNLDRFDVMMSPTQPQPLSRL